ncbi:MAG: hypothetical protein OSJ31_08935 [Alistipes sp.]|nr:hypothetical protein [Alistipes sp.]
MKNLFRVSLALAVVALTVSGCNCFKKMAKNRDDVKLTCTPEVLVLNNGRVDADITVTFPEKYFNKKAVVKVTPVMVFEGGEVAGTTQYLQGSKVDDNYTVIDKTNGGRYTQHVSFPYDDRMRQSELQLRAEIKCPGGKCKEFTLVNLNNGAVPTKEEAAVLAAGGAEADALKRAFGLTIAVGVNTMQKDIDYAEAMRLMDSGYKNVTTEVTKANYMYQINSSNLSKKAADTEEVRDFRTKAESQKDNDRIKQNLYVNGYASPDGPEKFNDKLSAARSQSGKKAAEKLLADIDLSLDAAFYGEDWEGFKELVEASDIEDKQMILQVLNMYSSSSERESQIKNMSQVFEALKKDILPQLRRAQLVNSSDITGKTDDEMVALVRAGKLGDLNEKELLHIAECDKLDAKEQVAVLEYAAKTYKTPTAYNNLGVAYAKAGDAQKAVDSFDKAVKAGGNSAEINNNIALANLMASNVDKAKQYAAGSSAQTKALIEAAQGNYSAAQAQLSGYNAAVASAMNNDYTAAKQHIAADKSAKADYLRAIIAAKENDMATSAAQLKSAIAKEPAYAERAKTDVNLRELVKSGSLTL